MNNYIRVINVLHKIFVLCFSSPRALAHDGLIERIYARIVFCYQSHTCAQTRRAHDLCRSQAVVAHAFRSRVWIDQSPWFIRVWRRALGTSQVAAPFAIHAHLFPLFLSATNFNREKSRNDANCTAGKRRNDRIDFRQLLREVNKFDKVCVRGTADAELHLRDGRKQTAKQ